MVMDLVFSIDSVITAVGMADHLIIMIIAVMVAVVMMMVFIDPISNFINGHPEMKMLALTFIVAIGALLVIDSVGFHTGIEMLHMPLEKLIVYFAMVFCIVLELIQMRYNKNFAAWKKSRWQEETAAQIETVRAEMLERIEEERKKASQGNKVPRTPWSPRRPRFSSAATFTSWRPSTARNTKTFASKCLPATPRTMH